MMALSIGLRKASTLRGLLVHGIIISAVMGSPPASVCFSREISLQTRAFLVITEETQCYCFLHSFGSGFPSTSVDGWLHRAIQTVHPKKRNALASFRGAAVQPIPASWGTSTRLQENFHQNIAFLKLLY